MKAGNFFPPEYKVFKYQEGDVLIFQNKDKFILSRILMVKKIPVLTGQTIRILNEAFTAPEDDYLIVVGNAFSVHFESRAAAEQAFNTRNLKIEFGFVPTRATGAPIDAIYLGNFPVEDAELAGYEGWRDLFDSGQAGIF